jgi:hypothetical protein
MKYAYSYKLKRLPLEVVVIEGVVSNEVAVMSLKELPKESRMFNMARTIDKTIVELNNSTARALFNLIQEIDKLEGGHPVYKDINKFIDNFITAANSAKDFLQGSNQ